MRRQKLSCRRDATFVIPRVWESFLKDTLYSKGNHYDHSPSYVDCPNKTLKREWNLLSVGDAPHERDAALTVGRHHLDTVFAKSIKFLFKPQPTDLLDQIFLINRQIRTILEENRCLDLVYEKEYQGGPCFRELERTSELWHAAWTPAELGNKLMVWRV